MAAQVISGIGFLGAGTIMKEGPLVTGLTTAASIWVVSAIGLAVGFGYYSGAILATILAFATLSLLYQLEKRLKARSRLKVVITLVNDRSKIEEMCQTLRLLSADINDIIVDEVEGGEELNVTFLISMRGGRDRTMILRKTFYNLRGVRNVMVE